MTERRHRQQFRHRRPPIVTVHPRRAVIVTGITLAWVIMTTAAM